VEAPRVAWLIPMSHSRSATGVWKRDEPQGRLRDATSPQGDARSKPSKSGGTTRTEGAGGLADPCTAARESGQATNRLTGAHGASGSDEHLWWKPGMKSGRTRMADVDGGALTGTRSLRATTCCTLTTPGEEARCWNPGHLWKSTPPDVPARQASRIQPSEPVGHRIAVLEGEAKARKVGSRADPTTLEHMNGKHLEDPPRQSAGQGQEGRVEKANDPQPGPVSVPLGSLRIETRQP
jgi:hypothetical protein